MGIGGGGGRTVGHHRYNGLKGEDRKNEDDYTNWSFSSVCVHVQRWRGGNWVYLIFPVLSGEFLALRRARSKFHAYG